MIPDIASALAARLGTGPMPRAFRLHGRMCRLHLLLTRCTAVHDMPVTPRTIDLGLRCRTYSGVYQINVVAPAGSGRTSVVSLAGRVVQLFPEGLEIAGSDFTCWITSTPAVFRGIPTAVSYTIPISLNYRADIIN